MHTLRNTRCWSATRAALGGLAAVVVTILAACVLGFGSRWLLDVSGLTSPPPAFSTHKHSPPGQSRLVENELAPAAVRQGDVVADKQQNTHSEPVVFSGLDPGGLETGKGGNSRPPQAEASAAALAAAGGGGSGAELATQQLRKASADTGALLLPGEGPEEPGPGAKRALVSNERPADCKIAFIAAITSPPEGGLSPRTQQFTEAMFLSALSKHYTACPVVLTNVRGNFDFLRERLQDLQEIVYEDIWEGPSTYMYDRTRSYVKFLRDEAASDSPRNLVFTDTDILYVKTLKEIFDKPFDIGLTYRLMPKYPINNGIMFAHRERLLQASDFWARIVEIYDEQGYDKKWQGDQYAVCKFMEAAGKYYTGRRNGIKNVSGVNVMLLHVSNFNFPPRSGCKITNQVKVLHFKGDEKPKLPMAWKILQKGRGSKALDEVAWLKAPKTQRARGNLKNCQDS